MSSKTAGRVDPRASPSLRPQTTRPTTPLPSAVISGWPSNAAKRALDLAIAVPGVLLLVLFGLVVVLAIRLDSPGPSILSQRRIGRHGAPFAMLKFRSMYVDVLGEARPWTTEGDPRITRVGRWLRALHIDELPQFLNVIRGEMSVVGPRPEQAAVAEELRRAIPGYRRREQVRPGMISSASLKQGYVDSIAGSREKLVHDLGYLANASLAGDLRLLLGAVAHSLMHRGR